MGTLKAFFFMLFIALLGNHIQPSAASTYKHYGEGVYAKDIGLATISASGGIDYIHATITPQGQVTADLSDQIKVTVSCKTQYSRSLFNMKAQSYRGNSEKIWATKLRKAHCPKKSISSDTQQTAKTTPPPTKTNTYTPPSTNLSPKPRSSQQIQSRPQVTTTAQNQIHEKCLDARDYQGCVNSFSGNRSSTSTGLSEYERAMIQLRREELERQRQQDTNNSFKWQIEQRERAREADRARQREQNKAWHGLIRGLNEINNPTTVTCTSKPHYLGGLSTTCQ